MEENSTAPTKILPSARFARILVLSVVTLIVVLAIRKYVETKDEVKTVPIITAGSAPIAPEPDSTSFDFESFFAITDMSENQIEIIQTPSEKPKPTPTAPPSEVTPKKKPSYTEYDDTPKIPDITGLSNSTFGNGDTIIIYGENFTSSNKVILSIDLPEKFTGIPSVDGKSITFKANLTLSASIAKDLANVPEGMREEMLERVGQAQPRKKYIDGKWYLPATISIKNANGASTRVAVHIDVTKGIPL